MICNLLFEFETYYLIKCVDNENEIWFVKCKYCGYVQKLEDILLNNGKCINCESLIIYDVEAYSII